MIASHIFQFILDGRLVCGHWERQNIFYGTIRNMFGECPVIFASHIFTNDYVYSHFVVIVFFGRGNPQKCGQPLKFIDKSWFKFFKS